jgi:hypothetical protein
LRCERCDGDLDTVAKCALSPVCSACAWEDGEMRDGHLHEELKRSMARRGMTPPKVPYMVFPRNWDVSANLSRREVQVPIEDKLDTVRDATCSRCGGPMKTYKRTDTDLRCKPCRKESGPRSIGTRVPCSRCGELIVSDLGADAVCRVCLR